MSRGLMWLPLLAIFSWLAWAGRREFLQVEAYKHWAKGFERHKYDIYAVLGQQGDRLTWGIPTTGEPQQLKTITFGEINQIQILLDQVAYTTMPANLVPRHIAIQFNGDPNLVIPFTDLAIASQWFTYLRTKIPSKP